MNQSMLSFGSSLNCFKIANSIFWTLSIAQTLLEIIRLVASLVLFHTKGAPQDLVCRRDVDWCETMWLASLASWMKGMTRKPADITVEVTCKLLEGTKWLVTNFLSRLTSSTSPHHRCDVGHLSNQVEGLCMKVVSAEIFISFEKLNDNILILFKPFGKEGLFGSGSIARVKREHPEKKLLAMFRQLFYMLLDPL